jgi:hypothetical protein
MTLFHIANFPFCFSWCISNLVLKLIRNVNTHLANIHKFVPKKWAIINLNFEKWYHACSYVRCGITEIVALVYFLQAHNGGMAEVCSTTQTGSRGGHTRGGIQFQRSTDVCRGWTNKRCCVVHVISSPCSDAPNPRYKWARPPLFIPDSEARLGILLIKFNPSVIVIISWL